MSNFYHVLVLLGMEGASKSGIFRDSSDAGARYVRTCVHACAYVKERSYTSVEDP